MQFTLELYHTFQFSAQNRTLVSLLIGGLWGCLVFPVSRCFPPFIGSPVCGIRTPGLAFFWFFARVLYTWPGLRWITQTPNFGVLHITKRFDLGHVSQLPVFAVARMFFPCLPKYTVDLQHSHIFPSWCNRDSLPSLQTAPCTLCIEIGANGVKCLTDGGSLLSWAYKGPWKNPLYRLCAAKLVQMLLHAMIILHVNHQSCEVCK